LRPSGAFRWILLQMSPPYDQSIISSLLMQAEEVNKIDTYFISTVYALPISVAEFIKPWSRYAHR